MLCYDTMDTAVVPVILSLLGPYFFQNSSTLPCLCTAGYLSIATTRSHVDTSRPLDIVVLKVVPGTTINAAAGVVVLAGMYVILWYEQVFLGYRRPFRKHHERSKHTIILLQK